MKETAASGSGTTASKQNRFRDFAVDLAIYIAVMFLVREIYFQKLGFIANGLFWSFSTLVVATWRMKARGVTWKELGLRRPKSFGTTLLVAGLILVVTPVPIIIFEIVKDHLPFLVAPDTSEVEAVSKFGDLAGNWARFALILPFVWLESFLEELLDRGFLMNWLERMFSKTSSATILAVVLQAAIFGFRHSHDLSSRSITVGLIGLIMGTAYMVLGRNLWPLIVAHCALNSMSMLGRVV